MSQNTMTRRDALKAGAAAALGLAGHSAIPLPADAVADGPSTIGISTLGFPEHTNRQLAEELAKADFRVIQLFLSQKDSRYWVYNGRSDVSGA